MSSRRTLGRYGEDLAVRCLTDSGLHIIERNWRCARGEIDIVASEGGALVFCEVKTRSSAAYGDPAEAVDRRKSQRIRGLGLQWLVDHPGGWDEVRFDVISVFKRSGSPALIQHCRGAF